MIHIFLIHKKLIFKGYHFWVLRIISILTEGMVWAPLIISIDKQCYLINKESCWLFSVKRHSGLKKEKSFND